MLSHVFGFLKRYLGTTAWVSRNFTIKSPWHKVRKDMRQNGEYMDMERPKNTPRKSSPNESTKPARIDQYPRMHGISIPVHVEIMLSNSCILRGGGIPHPSLEAIAWFQFCLLNTDHLIRSWIACHARDGKTLCLFLSGLKSRNCRIAQKLLAMPSCTVPLLFSCTKPKQRKSKSVILFWRFLHILFLK